jgi:hypothetical protein
MESATNTKSLFEKNLYRLGARFRDSSEKIVIIIFNLDFTKGSEPQ